MQKTDLENIVKKYYPQIKKLGLNFKSDETKVVDHLKKYPQQMLNDLDEDEMASIMLNAMDFSNAFYTDFEGIEYEIFFDSLQKISKEEIKFKNVINEVSKETYEKGIGTSKLKFDFNGDKYDYTATFYYDWFDVKIISFLNKIIEEKGLDKRIIIFGDMNVSYITYQTPDFCQKIKEIFPMLEADVL
ncbi:hypothetical protein [Lachnobacterium bovis]|uniref:Uncharacterized protein n=1 Tax=Lachnobacterium bovis TaxID=140626 RepID=A0A1H9UVA0_9FIRM|nr:hypothetical protein [Lachnobacterium bovis]SES12923.1 hypothetical protein SAMN02910429_02260 [Lachnobacterium bovis]